MKLQLLNKVAYSILLVGGIVLLNSCSKKEINTSARTEKLQKMSRELEQYKSTGSANVTNTEINSEIAITEDISADASSDVTPLVATKPVVDLSKSAKEVEAVKSETTTKKAGKFKQKMAQKLVKKITASEKINELDGNLKIGLIFLLIGLIVSLLPVLWWIGTILVVIGLVFILLWLLNEL